MTSDGYGEDGYGGGAYGDSDSGGGDGDGTTQAPYGDTPAAIPGRIQAEAFDTGGEGVAYHETDPSASWSIDYRTDTDVDFKQAPGTTDGISVGRFVPEEWLEYTVTAESGVYDVTVRAGTDHADAELEISLDGETLAVVSMPETGWSAHDTVTVSDVGIESNAEEHVLRLSPRTSGTDVDWVEFSKTGTNMSKTATLELVLKANSLTVRVLDGTQDGQPAVDGATVEISGPSSDSGTTDANGEVVFEGLEVGDYDVVAYTSGLHASGSVSSSDFS